MNLFYGWIIVGTGIVVTCVGVGAMLSLSIFLQPVSEAMGWSRTGISTAALHWLGLGAGSFLWGALSDRLGTRAVVLLGGGLLGAGLAGASQTATLGQFQLVFGVVVGLAAGSFYAPLTATTTRWFTRHPGSAPWPSRSPSARRTRSRPRSRVRAWPAEARRTWSGRA